MRAVPAGIPKAPVTPGFRAEVRQPVSGPQQMRGPTSATFEAYKNQGSKATYEGRSIRN